MRVLYLFLLIPLMAIAALGQGSCPSGANYLDLTNPSNGGGNGSVTLASLGITSCYYVSATGLDSNTGADETHPFLHSPGMSSFTGSATVAAGVGVIFEGGGTWHVSSGTPATGGTWTWTYTGTSSHPVYFGIDPTWYSGGSFARPIINQDNPLNTSYVGSCSFADDGVTLIHPSGAWTIIDGLEFTGNCHSGGGVSSQIDPTGGTNMITERLYCHGWSMTSGISDDSGICVGNNTNSIGNVTNRHLFDVVDGSDSTLGNLCNTPSCVGSTSNATGYGFGDAYDVEYSVIRHVSNGIQSGQVCTLIGNDFEYIFSALAGRHSNIVEQNFGQCSAATSPQYMALYYNNVTGNTNDNSNNWVPSAITYYIFNNTWYNDQHFPPDPDGILLCGGGGTRSYSANALATVYFFNNSTQDYGFANCSSGSSGGGWSTGSTITFENNQTMDQSSVSSWFRYNSCNSTNCPLTDSGGEVYQTTSCANSQGYTYVNRWQPTVGTHGTACNSTVNATIHTGNTLTSTLCSVLPNSLAVTACQSGSGGAAVEIATWGGLFASYPETTANARGTTWDTGAYQFASSPNVTFVCGNSGAFGSIPINSSSSPTTCTLTNNIGSTLTISSITVTGTNASEFVISSQTCGGTLGNGSSCTMSLTFSPTVAGGCTSIPCSETATLQETDGSYNPSVSLTGTGIATTPCSGVAVVQTNHGFTTTCVANGSNLTCVISPSPTSAAHHAGVITAWFSGTTNSSSNGISSVSGNVNSTTGWVHAPNTFVSVGTPATGCNANYCSEDMFYNPSLIGGDTNFTVTLGAAPPTFYEVDYVEVALPSGSTSAIYDNSGSAIDSVACTSCTGPSLTLHDAQDIVIQTENASQECSAISSPYVGIDITTGAQYGGLVAGLLDVVSAPTPTYTCTSGTIPMSVLALAECPAAVGSAPHPPVLFYLK